MKVKSDFITNSSSSSFVVAIKKIPDFDKETLEKYPFLSFYKNVIDEFMRGDVYRTEDSVLESFGVEKKEELDEYELEDFESKIKYIKQGFEIRVVDVEYTEDSFTERAIQSLEDGKNFIIISQ